jgi:hypothetical protein
LAIREDCTKDDIENYLEPFIERIRAKAEQILSWRNYEDETTQDVFNDIVNLFFQHIRFNGIKIDNWYAFCRDFSNEDTETYESVFYDIDMLIDEEKLKVRSCWN